MLIGAGFSHSDRVVAFVPCKESIVARIDRYALALARLNEGITPGDEEVGETVSLTGPRCSTLRSCVQLAQYVLGDAGGGRPCLATGDTHHVV